MFTCKTLQLLPQKNHGLLHTKIKLKKKLFVIDINTNLSQVEKTLHNKSNLPKTIQIINELQ